MIFPENTDGISDVGWKRSGILTKGKYLSFLHPHQLFIFPFTFILEHFPFSPFVRNFCQRSASIFCTYEFRKLSTLLSLRQKASGIVAMPMGNKALTRN